MRESTHQNERSNLPERTKTHQNLAGLARTNQNERSNFYQNLPEPTRTYQNERSKPSTTAGAAPSNRKSSGSRDAAERDLTRLTDAMAILYVQYLPHKASADRIREAVAIYGRCVRRYRAL